MLIVSIIAVVAVVLVVVSITMFANDVDSLVSLAVFVIGVLVLAASFSFFGNQMRNGSPAMSLDPGTYKVAFVHVAGPTATFGIEKQENDGEHLYMVQIPAGEVVQVYGVEVNPSGPCASTPIHWLIVSKNKADEKLKYETRQ